MLYIEEQYARPTPPKFTKISLNRLISETLSFLHHQPLFKKVIIEKTLSDAVPQITADANQIRQVLTNIFINAAQAMPDGGKLTVVTRKVKFQELIETEITDTGTGIAPDVLPRIFEPFFTTRAPVGHGLGLSQVYGIVKQHDGHIDVETKEGQGTTFRLYLPALAAAADRPARAEEAAQVAHGEGETILVVEDDRTMRSAMVAILDMLNYRVLEAANGQEALEVCDQHGEKIALVLSDWVMPSMGGLELVRRLVEMRPAIAVLLLTGHPLSQEAKDAVPPNVVGWILKPSSLEQLADAVSQALDESSQHRNR